MEDRIELEFDKPLPAESSNLEETVAQPSSQPIKLTDEESRPEIVKPEKSRTKKKKVNRAASCTPSNLNGLTVKIVVCKRLRPLTA